MQVRQGEQGVPQVAPDLGFGQAGTPGLTVLLQTGPTQLRLQVQDATLLPGLLQPHTTWVPPHLLVAAHLGQLAGPVLGAPERRHGALDCIEPAILLGAHLEDLPVGAMAQAAEPLEVLLEEGFWPARVVPRALQGL